MAEKRMFSKKVIESDAFMSLPQSAQNLFFHLSMNGDDDGFVDNVSGVMAQTKTSQKDLDALIENGFLLHVSKFVYVITHWFINNNIQKDRFHPTIYAKEKSMLSRPNNIWQFADGASMYTEISKDQNNKEKKREEKKENKKKYGEYQNVLLTDQEYQKLQMEFPDYEARIEELSGAISQYGYKYDSHYATIRNWARRKQKEQEQKPKQTSFGDIAEGYEPTWDIDL